jgi:uncharacterized protein (TIGR00730 family)
MAIKKIALIYGGGNKGLMGAVANSALEHQGIVTGIIPKVLMEWEQHHRGLTELIGVEDMHARKRLLYEKCNAALILPGGFGTLDEMFEMLTWNQLSIHDKKIFILNTEGFYNHLIAHANRMQESQFLYDRLEDRFIILDHVIELAGHLD